MKKQQVENHVKNRRALQPLSETVFSHAVLKINKFQNGYFSIKKDIRKWLESNFDSYNIKRHIKVQEVADKKAQSVFIFVDTFNNERGTIFLDDL